MLESDGPMSTGWHVVPPQGGEVVAAFGSTIRFPLGGDETRGTLCLGLATTPPGAGPPLHVHLRDDELFIVVSGEMAFHTPGGWRDVVPGTVVYMPRGIPHTFRNRGTGPSSHWVLLAPSGFEKYFACSAEIFAGPGPADPAGLHRVAEEYGYTILGPPPGA